jgi:hypothetical protein
MARAALARLHGRIFRPQFMAGLDDHSGIVAFR